MLLIAKRYIWSKDKSKRVLPGAAFEVTDQTTIDRYLSTGAATKAPVLTVASLNIAENTGAVDSDAVTAPEDTAEDSVLTDDITGDTDEEETVDTKEDLSDVKIDSTDSSPAVPVSSLPYQIPGISSELIQLLVTNGYDTAEKITAATKEDLVKIPGLGYNNAVKILKTVKGTK